MATRTSPVAHIHRRLLLPDAFVFTGAAAVVGAEEPASAPAAVSGPVTAAVKCPKKSSAIFFATPLISRAPTCASRPPTCACARYTSRVPAPSVCSPTCAPPLPKPAAPPEPSNVSEYDSGAFRSVSVSLPLKRALIGPTAAAITTLKWFSSTRSSDSHPGTDARRISGSFSASHTRSRGSGKNCSPVSSMPNLLYCGQQRSLACTRQRYQ